ncbi:MAG TPA: AraC family transcriptional regulator [Planctomycetota bacterium]|nr:AraC family transcriptional regulator [Planctomycetota bacterium]
MGESRFPLARSAELDRAPIRVALGRWRAEIIGWGHIATPRWRNYLHAHGFYEICYAFAGRGTFRLLGVDHTVGAGQVFIARPRQEHEIIADRRDTLGICFWSFTLVRDPRGEADPAVDRLLDAFVDGDGCVGDRVPGMEATIRLMTEEIARAEAGHATAIAGLARKLLLDTMRASFATPLAVDSLEPTGRAHDASRLVEAARRYVRDNLARELGVRDIAAHLGISERHLARRFDRALGQSPMAMVIDERIASAQQLLLDPALSVKEIAARVGYADVRYFTTAFRRRTGYPPATWRLGGGSLLTAKRRRFPGFDQGAAHLQRRQDAMDTRVARWRRSARGRKSNKGGAKAK